MLEEKNQKIFKIAVFTVIIILIIGIVAFLIFRPSEYEKIEKEMKEAAQKYIKNSSNYVENQEFLTLNDLGITEGVELCSQASGVVVTNVSGKIKYSPYLKCIDYESDIIRNTTKYIELNGDEVVLVNAGTLYFDEGYTLKKEVDIETIGEVITKEPGAYTINYVVKKNNKQKTVVKRIVIVSSVDTAITSSGLINKEEPIINLKGEKEIYIAKNTKYVEPGYLAYDYKDGKITRKVEVKGDVNPTKEGVYEIKYSIRNSKGITYSVTRNVHVVQYMADLKIEISTNDNGAPTNESIVNIKISGDGFNYLILPNGSKTYNEFTYTAKANGVYTFKIVDVYGNIINKSIVIDNIDNSAPTGSCKVITSSKGSTIEVKANDESGIKSVNYIINGKESGFFEYTSYTTAEKITSASVILKDVAGNDARISCGIEKPKDVYTFNYNNDKPLIKCNSYTEAERQELEKLLSETVQIAGYGTRAGVVAAARFLVGGLDYRIPYLGPKNEEVDPDRCLGQYDKKGLNIANNKGWGCSVHGWTQGMDCTNFVSWAFVNGGLKLNGVYSTSNTYKTVDVVDKIQVGDLLLTPCGDSCRFESEFSHVGIVIGVDATKIYVAEATTGTINSIVVTEYEKNNMPTRYKFSVAKLYPYESDGNVTDMWN